MTDLSREAQESLEWLEQEQRERYRPTPQEPQTPAERYAKALDAARSKSVSIDAGWLR